MLDGVLGEIIVPGHPIVIEELEQLLTMLQESLSELNRRCGLGLGSDDFLVEVIDFRPVLCQVRSASASLIFFRQRIA
jgi:hypothetical protein